MSVRLTHAIYPEGPFFWFNWKRPYYGFEVRVWKEHWLWIGYTTKEDRERGW